MNLGKKESPIRIFVDLDTMKQPGVVSYRIREGAHPATNVVFLPENRGNDGRWTLKATKVSECMLRDRSLRSKRTARMGPRKT